MKARFTFSFTLRYTVCIFTLIKCRQLCDFELSYMYPWYVYFVPWPEIVESVSACISIGVHCTVFCSPRASDVHWTYDWLLLHGTVALPRIFSLLDWKWSHQFLPRLLVVWLHLQYRFLLRFVASERVTSCKWACHNLGWLSASNQWMLRNVFITHITSGLHICF